MRNLALAVGTTIVIVACGSSSDGGPAAAFVNGYCGAYAPCCPQFGKKDDGGAQCRQLYAAFTFGAAYDATAGRKCLDAIHAAQAKPDFCGSYNAEAESDDCQNVFKATSTGSKQPGEACTTANDCAASAEGGKVTCSTTCVSLVPGKEGSTDCVGNKNGNVTSYSFGDRTPGRGVICDLGQSLYCNDKTKTCTKLFEVGADCSTFDTFSCVKTAYCDGKDNKCAPRIALGAACLAATYCVEGAYCDQDTQVCTAQLTGGEACKQYDQCKSGSCTNKACAKEAPGFASALICAN